MTRRYFFQALASIAAAMGFGATIRTAHGGTENSRVLHDRTFEYEAVDLSPYEWVYGCRFKDCTFTGAPSKGIVNCVFETCRTLPCGAWRA